MDFLLVFLLLVVAVYAIVYGGISATLWLMGPPKPKKTRPPRRAFPVELLEDGAGRYQIFGVERETEKDQQFTVEADSRANALVKAELRGVVVTRIEKLAPMIDAG
jgi:hypothetical protein